MFKKLRKRRLSLSFKKKSTSLKDINVIETFVHKTAQIMSASAENLNSESLSSVNLVTLLDQSFQSTNKCSTAPTSNFGSPKYHNNKPYCKDKKSHSMENNVHKERDLQINNFYFFNDKSNIDNSQSIEVIFEENNSFSEMINSFVQYENNNVNNDDLQQSVSSGIFDSPKHVIGKHFLKRSFSFNDINIRHISSLKKKHGSIQTFISTNATLSVEIESKPDYFEETISSDEIKIQNQEIVFKYNQDFLINNKENFENKLISKGDEGSEKKDILINKENEDNQQQPVEVIRDSYFAIIGKVIIHPLFLTGVFITGIVILLPTINNKVSEWLSIEAPGPIEIEPIQTPIETQTISLKPLNPDFLFVQPSRAIKKLKLKILNDYDFNKENNIIFPFILSKIVKDQIKKGSAFLTKFYKND